MTASLHLIKLSVGTLNMANLSAWQSQPRVQTPQGEPFHITRMWPKREDELLAGGSIFWVIKGQILCRQTLLRFEECFDDAGKRHCKVICAPQLIPVRSVLKRAFQGWRYLKASDAPQDSSQSADGHTSESHALPEDMRRSLEDIGII